MTNNKGRSPAPFSTPQFSASYSGIYTIALLSLLPRGTFAL